MFVVLPFGRNMNFMHHAVSFHQNGVKVFSASVPAGEISTLREITAKKICLCRKPKDKMALGWDDEQPARGENCLPAHILING